MLRRSRKLGGGMILAAGPVKLFVARPGDFKIPGALNPPPNHPTVTERSSLRWVMLASWRGGVKTTKAGGTS
ncbi:hypothetical protein [Caulobacter sp. Root655]|uniref:hypothetical protein n=1 Tax=Caulobacter sp. Root655 TaxID=1736578 RepID=UPI000B113D49|nr:hypothetical protein [Caulobacter sp. Root655]